MLDGATNWQRFRHITLPMLSPIIAVVMTFSVLMTFTDFQLIYAITRGGPINATHLMATLSFQRAITGGNLGEGAAIANAMIPFLLAAILFSFFGLAALAAGSRAGGTDHEHRRRPKRRHGLSRELPAEVLARSTFRSAVIIFFLLFPFYWMAVDDLQAGRGAVRLREVQSVLDRAIRRSSTSRSCCSRPTIRSGCGTP